MIEQLDHVLDLLILTAVCVFLVLLVQGIRFTIQAMHDFRYGRVDIADAPDSPTSVAEF